ncbi:hypothetical protein DXG01_002977 [Tephrocybe rancida]|nr:hypothetical protein DXG01_002977 [Tephrocybe rancida]
MRPSSRLLVPALTVLTWSVEAAYSSFRPPAQSLYRRQVRSADYSTSSRPSYEGTNSASSPESDASSPSRPGPTTPPTSDKTKRDGISTTNFRYSELASRSKRRSSDDNDTYFKAYSGSDKPSSGIDQDVSTPDIHRQTPRSDFGQKKRSFSAVQNLSTRDIHRQTRSDNGQKLRRSGGVTHSYTKQIGYKNKKSTSAASRHHKEHAREGRKGVELHSLKEKKSLGAIRRSDFDLGTLHIARGIQQPQAHAADLTPSSEASKSLPGAQGQQPSIPRQSEGTGAPKSMTVTFNTPEAKDTSQLPQSDLVHG